MNRFISRLATAAAASLFFVGTASAATVNFTLTSATVAFGVPDDGTANIAYSVIPDTAPNSLPLDLVATSSNQIEDLFLFTGSGRDNSEDTFSLTATLVIDIIGDLLGPITYTFLGTVSNWAIAGNSGNVNSGAIDWGNPVPNPNSEILNLSLSDINLFSSAQPDGVVTSLTYRARDISVVPLPGGILLLGSALLGIFGLSRRRNRKLAAA